MNENGSEHQSSLRSIINRKASKESLPTESDGQGPFCVLKPGYFQNSLTRSEMPRSRETSVLIMERWDGKVWRAEF